MGLSTKPVVQNASTDAATKNRRNPGSPRIALTAYPWMSRFAKAIAAAKLAESASTCIPICTWNCVANIAPSGGVIAKNVSSEFERRRRRVGQPDTEQIAATTNDRPVNTTHSCAARRWVSTPREPSAPRIGSRGIAQASCRWPCLSLEVTESVDVSSPGAPPEQHDQREPEAADAARRDDGERRQGVAECAAVPRGLRA